jgi:hypothetical protein
VVNVGVAVEAHRAAHEHRAAGVGVGIGRCHDVGAIVGDVCEDIACFADARFAVVRRVEAAVAGGAGADPENARRARIATARGMRHHRHDERAASARVHHHVAASGADDRAVGAACSGVQADRPWRDRAERSAHRSGDEDRV